MRTADVVLHDRLVPESLLAEARCDAIMINVGKTPGEANLSQWEINELLVDHCRSGKTVCRLKGGDPFVFGRGGEEAMALAAAGLKWEVVPGVTSAIAAPAYAGIPVTHRGISSGVAVVTGSEDPDGPGNRVDWDAAAAFDGTLVVLMGWRNLPDIVDALTSRGRARGATGCGDQVGNQKHPAGGVRDIGQHHRPRNFWRSRSSHGSRGR